MIMEYEFKGTPGPWKKGKGYGSVVSSSLPDDKIMDRAELRHQEAYGGYLIAESIEDKNNALIAAAPDLLEALIDLLPHADHGMGSDHPTYQKAIAAIHKALNIKE
jgi:hypothetical protein